MLAAVVGAAVAIAVDRLLFDDGDGDAATAATGDVALTPDALGSGWSLDATVDLGGPDDVGLLSGVPSPVGWRETILGRSRRSATAAATPSPARYGSGRAPPTPPRSSMRRRRSTLSSASVRPWSHRR